MQKLRKANGLTDYPRDKVDAVLKTQKKVDYSLI